MPPCHVFADCCCFCYAYAAAILPYFHAAAAICRYFCLCCFFTLALTRRATILLYAAEDAMARCYVMLRCRQPRRRCRYATLHFDKALIRAIHARLCCCCRYTRDTALLHTAADAQRRDRFRALCVVMLLPPLRHYCCFDFRCLIRLLCWWRVVICCYTARSSSGATCAAGRPYSAKRVLPRYAAMRAAITLIGAALTTHAGERLI